MGFDVYNMIMEHSDELVLILCLFISGYVFASLISNLIGLKFKCDGFVAPILLFVISLLILPFSSKCTKLIYMIIPSINYDTLYEALLFIIPLYLYFVLKLIKKILKNKKNSHYSDFVKFKDNLKTFLLKFDIFEEIKQ